MTTLPLDDLALRAFRRHQALSDLGHYTGILSLHAFCRLAVIQADKALQDEAAELCRRFWTKPIQFRTCNYENYRTGGVGTAYLLRLGLLPDAAATVREYARQTLHEAPRARSGLVCHPHFAGQERVFIDQAFAVSPFLMYAGLALEDPACLDDAVRQAVGMVDLLRDPACGLLHQGVNFAGPGSISEDHWSRGNGWGLFALAELAGGLPAGDPRRPGVVERLRDLLAACLRVQDADGLWHQELTAPSSFVETSGTGLILYALGRALEHGLAPAEADWRAAFRRGLRGYLRYIACDGSVFHTCVGCLCPDGGKIESYLQRPWALNDLHAFGPVTLAYGQAIALGLRHSGDL